MTSKEFDDFSASFAGRFPFYKLTEERTKKLWVKFSDFTLDAAMAGLHAYDLAFPDLNGTTFRIGDLLHHCMDSAEKSHSLFSWAPCDEAEFLAESHHRRKRGLPEITVADFALYSLRKSRVPAEHERQKARETLGKITQVKSYAEVERRQKENNDAYTENAKRAKEVQAEMTRRNRERTGKTQKQDAYVIGDFARRAIELNERKAIS